MPKPGKGARNNGSLDLIDLQVLLSLTSKDTLEDASKDLCRAGLTWGVQMTRLLTNVPEFTSEEGILDLSAELGGTSAEVIRCPVMGKGSRSSSVPAPGRPEWFIGGVSRFCWTSSSRVRASSVRTESWSTTKPSLPVGSAVGLPSPSTTSPGPGGPGIEDSAA